MTSNPWEPQLDSLGDFIRAQRKQANLSLRELAALTQLLYYLLIFFGNRD